MSGETSRLTQRTAATYDQCQAINNNWKKNLCGPYPRAEYPNPAFYVGSRECPSVCAMEAFVRKVSPTAFCKRKPITELQQGCWLWSNSCSAQSCSVTCSRAPYCRWRTNPRFPNNPMLQRCMDAWNKPTLAGPG